MDAAWLAAETEAALAAAPVDFARLDALDALAAERGLDPPPELRARRETAEEARPSRAAACVAGVFGADLPNDPDAILCHFASALTVVGDGRDLAREGAKALAGEPVDRVTATLAAAGVGALALGPGAPAAKAAVAGVRTARRLGALSARFVDDVARRASAVLRIDATRRPTSWIDIPAARRLAAELGEIGRAGTILGPVPAIRALRHVERVEDAARLRRVAEAMGPRAGRALDALGPRAFRVFTRLNRATLELAALVLGLGAQLATLAAAAAQAGLRRRVLRLARA